MRDDELNTAVREAFERQALSAPAPDGLLETVRTRSRRRGIRNGVLGVAVAAAAIAGVTVAANALPVGRSELAPVAGPGAFAAAEINLCVAYDEGRLSELRLAWTRPGESETKVNESNGDPPTLGYVARGDGYTVRLDVYQRVGDEAEFDNAEPVRVDGRVATLASDADTGARALYVKTGVEGSFLVLEVSGAGDRPSDEQLVAWAEKVEVTSDPAECAS